MRDYPTRIRGDAEDGGPSDKMIPPNSDNSTKSWEELAMLAHYDGRVLASLLGVSLRTLQRHFSRQYQMTLGDFLSTKRMHEALRLLQAGESVKAVCYTLAFKQVSHFSRVFKLFFGAAPSHWKINLLDEVRFAPPSTRTMALSTHCWSTDLEASTLGCHLFKATLA